MATPRKLVVAVRIVCDVMKMRQHHTKSKGDLGVLKAQADLAEQGYMVLLPLTKHQAFDLVIYKDGLFKSVQVK
jgi:hypothetical protein